MTGDASVTYVPLPEQPIETNLSLTDNLFVKWYNVQKSGSVIPQHAHAFDHITVVARGGITVSQDGVFKGAYPAPTSFVVPANALHTFVTFQDDTILLCVHHVGPDGEPDRVQEHQIVGLV